MQIGGPDMSYADIVQEIMAITPNTGRENNAVKSFLNKRPSPDKPTNTPSFTNDNPYGEISTGDFNL